MGRTLVFDVLGTLLDISEPVAREAASLGASVDRLNDLWRAKQLEYAWVANMTGGADRFWPITERALDRAMATCGIADRGLTTKLLSAYREAKLYPEVARALADLGEQGHALVAFSNADAEMLDTLLSETPLPDLLDQVLSVEPAAAFKPSAAAYRFAAAVLQRSGMQDDVLFLSSNDWDVAGAHAFGWDVRWVNRRGMTFEYAHRFTPRSVTSLDELTAQLSHGGTA